MSAFKPNSGIKPRNSIFLKLRQRLLKSGGAGRHRDAGKARRDEDKDLADRIREVGEW